MTHRHFFLHRYGQVITIMLLVLVYTGYGKYNELEPGIPPGNWPVLSESTVATRHQMATLSQWTPSRHFLSGSEFRLTVDYDDDRKRNTNTYLANAVVVDSPPVEQFYALLRLCVLSRECPGD